MINPHAHRTVELAAETRATAANIEYEWDRRALDWPLTRRSIVVEIGGYKGRWALQIAERYQPRLYVFEPQLWAAETCRAVLGERATVHTYALGTEDGALPMARWETDGATLVGVENGVSVQMREIGAAFADLGLTHINLMLINIEGYEYLLIPHMLDCGIFPQYLMVQFHTVADPGGTQQARIRKRLARHRYRVAWSYGNPLTAWERR